MAIMKPYRNKSKNSGIVAFEAGRDFLLLKFKDGEVYRYDWKKPGKAMVEKMKRLAESGAGLATYINKYIRKNFAKKL